MVGYRVISSSSLGSFVSACDEALNDGWELVGGIAIREREFLQTLTRTQVDPEIPIVKKKRGRPKGSKGKAVRPKSKTL